MRRAIRRDLRHVPWLLDSLTAAVLLMVMVATIVTKKALPGQHANNASAYLLAVTMALPFAFHRRLPMLALTVVLASLLAFAAQDFAAYPGINAFVLLAGVALHSDRRRSLVAFVATAVVMTTAVLIQPSGVVDKATALSTALATVVFWLVGENVRQRRGRWQALRERNESLEREREDRARQAVIEERLRIARELHDIVAHAMSVVAVQSGVGHHVIDANPGQAKLALAAIETTTRAALTEMRRLLGVLRREDDPAASLAPAPGLRDVPALIRHVADGGLIATLRITGTPTDIPPGVDLSAYRIVQEALTNVIKHGGPRAEVNLAYTERDVRVEITNEPALNDSRGQHVVSPGHGIIGMRERAAAFGGEFCASPRPGGGFGVSARLPLEEPRP
jgi:signal transduction histidine kinase